MELLPDNAYRVCVHGEITEITPVNGHDFQLEEVQNLVDGYIEIVHLGEEQIMIINEEGKFNKSYNPFATAIAQLHGSLMREDYICGDVVICPSALLP